LRKPLLYILVNTMAVLALASCNLPRSGQSMTPTGDSIGTAAAQTVDALSTLLVPASTATAQNTALPATSIPTGSVATNTPASQTTTAVATAVPCDRAEFVDDITVPDGTNFAPGTSFVKTWRLKNNGSCNWTNSYRVVFDSGNALGAPASFNLPSSVAPNGTIDISVNMKAPDTAGDYESYWKLQNASGTNFGLGANGEKSFWVKITVGTTALPFAVTKVSVNSDNANVTASCPYTFHMTAAITTSAGGDVTYYWERSDGVKTDTQRVTFDDAGTKTISTDIQIGASFDGWVKLYIDNPNHQLFAPYNLQLTCNP
jgi:hypothetical protein